MSSDRIHKYADSSHELTNVCANSVHMETLSDTTDTDSDGWTSPNGAPELPESCICSDISDIENIYIKVIHTHKCKSIAEKNNRDLPLPGSWALVRVQRMWVLVDSEVVERTESLIALMASICHFSFVSLDVTEKGLQIGEHDSTRGLNAFVHLFTLMCLHVTLELEIRLAVISTIRTDITAVYRTIVRFKTFETLVIIFNHFDLFFGSFRTGWLWRQSVSQPVGPYLMSLHMLFDITFEWFD